MNGMEAAGRCIDTYFPNCEAALLAGSVVQGGETSASDLDLIVFDESQEGPFRRTYRAFGWIIEAFVMTRDSYRYFFDQAIDSAIPSMLRMCACGQALKGEDAIRDIVSEARDALAAGPFPWSVQELDRARYEIGESLADLSGDRSDAECLFIVAKLTLQLASFALRSAGCWLGDGKWLYRELERHSLEQSRELLAALDAYYTNRNPEPLFALTGRWLEPYGGLLAEGYAEGWT
ncbi:nucleotidyltransferase domain-containing protein [Paenibacillus validus]|uniref:Nucleotidyltransferase domain-containing protein n=2 Tax=Paenibacillus TaxID=44249 RepID=A0A7X2ZD89_9BACL|nr:nucleotidyltransferase domain-containing protein [Paenibacillus validus]